MQVGRRGNLQWSTTCCNPKYGLVWPTTDGNLFLGCTALRFNLPLQLFQNPCRPALRPTKHALGMLGGAHWFGTGTSTNPNPSPSCVNQCDTGRCESPAYESTNVDYTSLQPVPAELTKCHRHIQAEHLPSGAQAYACCIQHSLTVKIVTF